MKLISLKYIIVFASFTLLVSCVEDDFLKEEPLDFYSSVNSFVTLENFQGAVVDLYAQFRSLRFNSSNNSMALIYGTDVMFDARLSTTNNRFGDYNVSLNPTSQLPYWHWSRLYKIISSANSIIERIAENNTIADSDKALIVAQASYFRAHAYRNLVHLFGDVPLLLKEVTTPQADFTRQPRQEVYDQIIIDLIYASENLPSISSTQDGKLSNLVAFHLLAEMYLVLGDLDQAIKYTSKVIDDPATELMTGRFGSLASSPGDTYYDLFRVGNQNRSSGNTEAIWVEQIEVDLPGGFLISSGLGGNPMERILVPASFTLIDPDGNPGSLGHRSTLNSGGRGVGFMMPTDYVENQLWENDFNIDIRNSEFNYVRDFIYDNPASAYFDSSAVKYPGANLIAQRWRFYPFFSKVTTPGQHPSGILSDPALGLINSGGGSTYADQYYLRLPETLLLRAEAYLAKGDLARAASDINQVRTRSNATVVQPGEVTIDYILDERARELTMEEDRRILLLRLGKLVERVQKYNPHNGDEIQEHHALWPIPASEIEANVNGSLTQNPGY
ncbi:RagB/SusD family nutrient uptake outer membrane protein [Algoriphagus sp. D3-2-R+10]|uniref:RagB/SusD family nutrient uptake outer membrane protein n=1 Tax=Algoriphagus aurantiacus TaxID=3103948 RepID=UPI002B3EC4BE|nr:RagB/SusD family nutrient uptake outer membrane protein [Algoriphagus sp. D3-2-R+10]MEB2777389.1 RagB/SusD family nutrient uptake outer membrane protein [Algoriphagus sp. D3-2-R+10]